MAMFSAGGEAEGGVAEGENHSETGDNDGILGSTTSMLRGSMTSMGIGKKDESALSVGRVRTEPTPASYELPGPRYASDT